MFVYSRNRLKKNKKMKAFLELMKKVVKIVFPDSKWANIAYMLLGVVIAQFDQIEDLIKAILTCFK